MSPPSSVPEQYRPGFLPPSIAKQMQENLPGAQGPLEPAPLDDILADGSKYKPAGKLAGKNALVTGGDSGIGRAVAILYQGVIFTPRQDQLGSAGSQNLDVPLPAPTGAYCTGTGIPANTTPSPSLPPSRADSSAYEGANLFIHYHPAEEKDAQDVKKYIADKSPQTKVELYAGDLRTEAESMKLVEAVEKWSNNRLDVLVNNHGTQNEVPHIEDLSHEQWRHVFDVNIHSFFYLTKNLIPIMPWGGSIINNASINPFVGHPKLLDYTSTKGAIVGFTRALSNQIVKEKGVRVNAVCPGPIWTPLVAATMGKESLENFGPSTAIGRAGQPVEVATAFVFLASADSSYFTAQCFHVNGGSPY